MKKAQIKTGGRYTALVSGTVTTVRIQGESIYGGWNAVNEKTGRQVHVRSAQRLRREVVNVVLPAPSPEEAADLARFTCSDCGETGHISCVGPDGRQYKVVTA